MTDLAERKVTAVLAVMALIGSFVFVTMMRRTPAVPQPSFRDQAISAYVSETGFRPFTYLRRSEYESYVMLDVIQEGGDRLRFVEMQIFENSSVLGNSVTYAQYRVNCINLDLVDFGEGENVRDMLARQGEQSLHYTPLPLTFQYQAANAACRYLKGA